MKISVAQMGVHDGEVARNLSLVLEQISKAAAEGSRLLVFPECTLTGYLFESRRELAQTALEVQSREIELIQESCRVHSLYVVIGFFEKDGLSLYNTALLIGPEGNVGRHRKRHLPFLGGDRFVDLPADEPPPVFATDIGNIGIAICYEIRFPDFFRTLALADADIVALPTNWLTQSSMLAELFTRVRAAENFIYLAVANRNDKVGERCFMGGSQIVDPSGSVLINAGAEAGVCSAHCQIERARNKSIVIEPGVFEVHPFRDRRPTTYMI